ncbi:hypothetical protein S-MbCM7_175 [Synechococcus phage ACG-2014h]|uniref:Uncharacterized protein n=1 Tax=Synechococcus phage ACG-2014h TaxID=1340810 RepID=V5UU10_9CAUD|nr:hypothetical protein S-MbCM7_175 [Synechococcus phage ACG-2014h]AHB80589.1 hypothetical protein S-MbCM7_175 [Synechococcus phage ACG-2014h]
MSVKSQVQAAEEALRQALINALAEGDEDCLSELFTQYQAVSNLNKKVNDIVKFAFDDNYSFDLSSPYLNKPGKDLDIMDNLIDFPINAAGPVSLGNSMWSEDVITFGDADKSRDD